MKNMPILFSEGMVRAILSGKKRQTRRIAKLTDSGRVKAPGSSRNWHVDDPNAVLACPYGQPGDRLWVRETFGFTRQCDDVNDSERVIAYRAGGEHVAFAKKDQIKRIASGDLMCPNHWCPQPEKWTPPIHMPRWVSRITLEIERVGLQRLMEISEEDASWEGVEIEGGDSGVLLPLIMGKHRHAFFQLWDSINGPGSWAVNPIVWVVKFKRVYSVN